MEYIQSCFAQEVKIIRIMPNTPLLIGQGACAFSRSANVTDQEFQEVLEMFRLMGCVEVIQESQMNEIIPVNGSPP